MAGNSSFQVAFDKLAADAREIARHFGQRGHREHMTNLQEQLLERVAEFEQACGRDQADQVCDGCGRGTAKIGEACSHCGETIECAAF